MKNHLSTLLLNSISLCFTDDDPKCFMRLDYNDPVALQSSRSHFHLLHLGSDLRATLLFSNARLIDEGDQRGTRRKISVAISDSVTGRYLYIMRSNVHIPSDRIMQAYAVTFRCIADMLDLGRDYLVTVTDIASGQILGSRSFRIYPPDIDNRLPGDWITPVEAWVSPAGSDSQYRLVEAHHMTCLRICFRFEEKITDLPLLLPEVECEMHLPGGGRSVCFADLIRKPEHDGYLYAEFPYLVYPQALGICHVDVKCLNMYIGSFVFTTFGITVEGTVTGSLLGPIGVAIPETIEDRLKRSLELSYDDSSDDEDEEPVETDDELDRRLEEFIASELASDDGDEEDTPLPAPQPDSPFDTLYRMTGLSSVKSKLITYQKLVKFNQLRSQMGFTAPGLPLHAMFLGSPGTGKTTVAKIIGQMLHEVGVLSRGHLVIKERATLSGPHYGDEEANTLKAIDEAQGGILLIDEAYQLCQPNDPRDPGHMVIETLMTALADDSRRDWMLILAGYPDEMMRLFDLNPGLRSRIPESNWYTFDDFTVDDLMEIAERYFERYDYRMSDSAREALCHRLTYDFSVRDRSFGNARHVINMIQTLILPAMAVRVMDQDQPGQTDVSVIEACDIPAPAPKTSDNNKRIGFCA